MEVYLDDDDVDDDHLISVALREGHRLLSPRGIGLRGVADAVHLREAVSRKVPILSRNYRDFPDLHDLVVAVGGSHHGVILIRRDNDPTRDMSHLQIARALTRLEKTMPDLTSVGDIKPMEVTLRS